MFHIHCVLYTLCHHSNRHGTLRPQAPGRTALCRDASAAGLDAAFPLLCRASSLMTAEHRSPSFASLVCLAGWTAQEEHLAPPSPEALLSDHQRRASLEAVHSVLHRAPAFEKPSSATRDQRLSGELHRRSSPLSVAAGAEGSQDGHSQLLPVTPQPLPLAHAARQSASGCRGNPGSNTAQADTMDDGLGSQIATSAVPSGISFSRGVRLRTAGSPHSPAQPAVDAPHSAASSAQLLSA